jgi:hypothetical protein
MYAFESALIDMIEDGKVPESLRANYGRLHVLALRIAILLASFDNDGRVELRHWARAQQFADNRRRDLHELYAYVNSNTTVSEAAKLEDIILKKMVHLRERGIDSITVAVLRNSHMKQIGSQELKKAMDGLESAGLLKKEQSGHTIGKYSLL